MRSCSILLGIISLVAFPVWAALADGETEPSAKSHSSEPSPGNSVAQSSNDREGAPVGSLHGRVDRKRSDGKGTGQHHLLTGQQQSRGANMGKTRQPLPLPNTRQRGGVDFQSRIQAAWEPHQAGLPGPSGRPGAALPPLGATTHIHSPVETLNHTLPMSALIPRTPTPARIGGSPGANARTTAALNGTGLQHKP